MTRLQTFRVTGEKSRKGIFATPNFWHPAGSSRRFATEKCGFDFPLAENQLPF
ncbi:hypothetical protein [Thalassospira marina]|uniref:hypothetical protein n=1 Tax=Thalassospira marina TaxID=2048283 RepID=UPI0012FF37F2|nr:hypothetical protein [Thalassospira marina]